MTSGMNLGQLRQGPEQAFYKENHRIVFWYDPEQSLSMSYHRYVWLMCRF